MVAFVSQIAVISFWVFLQISFSKVYKELDPTELKI